MSLSVLGVMEYVMLVMFCCSNRIGGLGQLQQIWMTAKLQNFKCQSSQRKIRNIQSESVSKTAGCFTTRSNCSFHTAALIRNSRVPPYFLVCSCVQNIQKRLHSESLFSNSCERVRGRHQSESCSGRTQQSKARTKKCALKVRRESVWLFRTASVFQTHQAVNLLYLKSIFSHSLSLCICTWWHWTIFLCSGARRSYWSSSRSVWVMWSVATPTTPPHPQYTGQRKSLMSPC